jgi:hypothetical protein
MIADTEILSTADLVAAAPTAKSQREAGPGLAVPTSGATDAASALTGEPLAPLFQPQEARDFRATWDTVQIGFVDDPKQAVRKADELVAQVMKTLAESFANERAKLERQVDQTDQGSTENLRVALRRYRSFFQRLLSL